MTTAWHNARSGHWWARWFNTSIYQSGRLAVLLVLCAVLAVQLSDPLPARLIRARVFDFYQQTRPRPVPKESPVVIIDIDEKSLVEQGQFPWPRTVVADLVTRATELGVEAIGFDIMFAEEDQTSIAKVAARTATLDSATRANLMQAPSNDKLLADAIAASGKVVLAQNSTDQAREDKGEPPLTSYAALGGDAAPYLEKNTSILRPLAVLDDAAAGRGIISLSKENYDGIVRQVPMAVSVGDGIYPALSLEMLRVKLGAKTITLKTDAVAGGISEISIRPVRSRERNLVKTDTSAQIWVYFRPHQTFAANYVSATDLLNGRVAKERLAGKFALVGTSASGLLDLRSTPLDPVLPGVEVHANILENIIFSTQLTRPPPAHLMEWAITFIVGMIMIIITPMVGARAGAMTFLAMAGGMVWYSWSEFSAHLELYDPTFPIAVALLFYSYLTYTGYAREEAQRRQVRSAFGQYLSPALVEKLAEDPSKLVLGGENREMTFMFSDVRGFTAISEMFDAQGLTRLINRLLTPLTNAILSTNGTIDKYMGDCVMAFWNAPLDVEDHAAAAARSALRMVEAVNSVNAALEQEAQQAGRPHKPLAIGIGINSGVACVGNMGSDQRFDYSVLGDAVNLASRLESQSKSYGVTIVMGENSAKDVRNFALLELDLIQVKGKKQAARIFTLAGDEATAGTGWFKELRTNHDAALAAYRARQWDEADARLAVCRKTATAQTGLVTELCGFYTVLAERIATFRTHPPAVDWDGVYVATSK